MRVNHKFKSIPYVSDNVPPEVLKYREIHNSLIQHLFYTYYMTDIVLGFGVTKKSKTWSLFLRSSYSIEEYKY